VIDTIINWILGHLPAVIFVVILVAQMIRAANRSRQARAEQEREAADPAAEHRHEQEARDEIRRRIAERRAGGAPAEPPPLAEARPAPSPEATQRPDVFDGPLGRMLQELQKRAEPAPAPPPPAMAARNVAEVERQEQLAEELRVLAETRAATQRRAAQIAAERAQTLQAEPALRAAARDRLLGDLGDPQSLRRAFVLREVLGAPVGLR
jgi:hypothetical protein